MPPRTPEQSQMTWLFTAMAVGLIAYAGSILWNGQFSVRGKYSATATTYLGAQAYPWAAMIACFGIAMLGLWLRRGGLISAWMALWFIAGIGAVLAPILLL